jgi:hypothetical protein
VTLEWTFHRSIIPSPGGLRPAAARSSGAASALAVAVAAWIGGAGATAAPADAPAAVSLADAELLAGQSGDVHVPGATVSVEAARRLAEHAGGRLVFDDLADLPAETAAALALHRGGLVFTRLAGLAPDAARELALEGSGELRLPALVTPSWQTLRELAAFDGLLALDGVRSLPLNVADEFKARRRKTSLRSVKAIGATPTTWRAWVGADAAEDDRADRQASDYDGEDDDPEEDDDPGEKSFRGRRAARGGAGEDDAQGNADDPDDDSGVIGDDG